MDDCLPIRFLFPDQAIVAKFIWLSNIDLYTCRRDLKGKKLLLWFNIKVADINLPFTRLTCSEKVRSSPIRIPKKSYFVVIKYILKNIPFKEESMHIWK